MTDTTALLEKITGKPVHPDPKTTGKVKAYAWARVSTDMQEQRGESIEQQLREIQTYADMEGYDICTEFRETASAFGNGKRRIEFNRMIEKAKADPDIKAIIVHDLSRFSRDSITGRALMRELRDAGIRVVSVSDANLDPETTAGVYNEAFTFAKNEAYSRELALHTIKGSKANLRMKDPQSGWCFKNGGKALWGYRNRTVEHGIGRGGRPNLKLIWELDDTVVGDKSIHEWARFCLVDMAMKGASYAELRDFCNDAGIPGRCDEYWGLASWKDLLAPWNILKYAGYGVWNVRGKHSKAKPAGELEIVENAHPAIITVEEARLIGQIRQVAKRDSVPHEQAFGRARGSDYLLSGGKAVCARCGRNLVGNNSNGNKYYVCGSEPYRRGRGCGPGVYVPKLLLESEVIKDIEGLIAKLSDPVRFTRKVNEELRRIWEQETGYDPNAQKRINDLDRRIGNVQKAIEDGLHDASWANTRIRELGEERERLSASITHKPASPIQVDSEKALECRKQLDHVLEYGKPEERKKYIQAWIESACLLPEEREIEIQYRVPDSIVNGEDTGTPARFHK